MGDVNPWAPNTRATHNKAHRLAFTHGVFAN